jgi:DivIVA domain-containing protein
VDDLNPESIVSYRFKQAIRGYAVDEVDALLDRLADQVERHLAELDAMRERLTAAEAAAETTRETEATLQRTLVVAQQAADRTIADAETQAAAERAAATEDAERLRSEAEGEAERVRREAAEEAEQVRGDAQRAADHTLEEAQRLARREVDAARARVDDAASRHAEVITSVAAYRGALRAHLDSLEELAREVPSTPQLDLVAGELPGVGADLGWAADVDPVVETNGEGGDHQDDHHRDGDHHDGDHGDSDHHDGDHHDGDHGDGDHHDAGHDHDGPVPLTVHVHEGNTQPHDD